MPARVHAILVVRPDGRTPAALHLRRTLAALQAQRRRADALTIVLCGADDATRELAAASGAEGVITAPRSTGFAEALALATHRVSGDALWLLAQDTAPEPDALALLTGALELAPSVGYAAPKLVRWDDRTQIVSLGVSITRHGRTVDLADGELDQGQHDGREDVLAADVRGLLVRTSLWRELAGLDRGLAGADEGLDLGIRVRLAGGRVVLVPAARVATAGDGVAGLPDVHTARRRLRREYAVRAAQLHRRLVYAPPLGAPLHWLAALPLALWRSILHLIAKRPGRIGPEWAAAVVAMVRIPAVVGARSRIRRTRVASWAAIAPLRITALDLRSNLALTDEDRTGDARARELRFFSGGGAWAVLAALVVSVAAFPSLLTWPVLGGGALAPLRSTVSELWADAAYGQRQLGLETIAPADPFASLVALLGSLWPAAPSQALVALWVLALPAAVLGGWFAATRVTDRSVLRVAAGVAWALAPTFLTALVDGRPTGVFVHLLLPWLFFAASVAHRAWTSAAVASVLLAAVIASAPSLAPALALVWLLLLLAVAIVRRGRGAARIAWLPVPSLALAAPLVWHQLAAGNPWGLLADPGVVWAGPVVAADAVGRGLLAAGFPTADPGGWGAMLDGAPTWWVPLLVVPVAVAALLSPLTTRWSSGTALLIIAASGLATAFAAVGIEVSATGADVVALWPGAGLSLAWLGLLGAALVTLDVVPGRRGARALAATVVMASLAVCAVPALTATTRGAAALTDGPSTTLPAYVAAEGRGAPGVGTLVLAPLADGAVTARVVWGESETLGGQSTARAARIQATAADVRTAQLAADLATDAAATAIAELAASGIGFVVLAPAADTEAAAAVARTTSTSLDERDELASVGETAKGTLWRVAGEVPQRADASADVQESARRIAAVQLLVLAVAALLALPTAQTRREGRRLPRVVGRTAREGRWS